MDRKLLLLENAFTSLAKEYGTRKKAIASKVDKWIYTSSSRFDVRPEFFNRHGWTPGRKIRQLGEDKANCAAEGLNDQGQVIVVQSFNSIGYYESFVTWSECIVEDAHFDYGKNKEPIFLLNLVYVEGVPIACYSVARCGASVERYTWSDEKLVLVEVQHTPRVAGYLGELSLHHIDELKYQADGKLHRIEVLWPEKPDQSANAVRELVYERRGSRIYRKL